MTRCTECSGQVPETSDANICTKCLRNRLKYLDGSDLRDLSRRGTEQVGRPARSPGIVGSMPESIRHDEETGQ